VREVAQPCLAVKRCFWHVACAIGAQPTIPQVRQLAAHVSSPVLGSKLCTPARIAKGPRAGERRAQHDGHAPMANGQHESMSTVLPHNPIFMFFLETNLTEDSHRRFYCDYGKNRQTQGSRRKQHRPQQVQGTHQSVFAGLAKLLSTQAASISDLRTNIRKRLVRWSKPYVHV
jgi:hypothetical protein